MGQMMDMGSMMNAMTAGMWLWMGLWALVGVAVLVLAVIGLFWLARGADGRGPTPRAGIESAVELLRRRYVAGEIDDDEYARRQAGLS